MQDFLNVKPPSNTTNSVVLVQVDFCLIDILNLSNCGYEDARGDQCDDCGATYEAIELKNPRLK